MGTGMTGRVKGKVALVTGGASGLGKSTAELLVAEGARVAVTDIDEAAGRAVVDRVNASSAASAIFLRHDVTDEDQWKSVLGDVTESFGGLHILVNNAGISLTRNVEELELEEWRRVHAVDLDSVFLGCKHAIKDIAVSGGGSIVNISSIAGIIAGHNMAAYNSAKAAVRHLSKSVALHCARKGYNIRCNSVHPAFVDTPILDEYRERFGPEEALRKLGRQVPLGRVGLPVEVAYGILYLASDESTFTTGSELIIDGGISAM
jgi:3(or 17)beta-hydroxysteroid dehydrogenase